MALTVSGRRFNINICWIRFSSNSRWGGWRHNDLITDHIAGGGYKHNHPHIDSYHKEMKWMIHWSRTHPAVIWLIHRCCSYHSLLGRRGFFLLPLLTKHCVCTFREWASYMQGQKRVRWDVLILGFKQGIIKFASCIYKSVLQCTTNLAIVIVTMYVVVSLFLSWPPLFDPAVEKGNVECR